MPYNGLDDGYLFGIQRGKLNGMLEELYNIKLETSQVLTKSNVLNYTPTLDYHPATKLYADQMRTNWDNVFNPQEITNDVFARSSHTGTIPASVVEQDAANRFVTDILIASWNNKEDAIGTKNTAFNRNFGTVADSVAMGNHTHTKADLSLGNVDNTSDVNKPISTAQGAALDLKAPITTTYTKDEVDDFLDNERDITNSLFGDQPNGNYSEFDEDGVLTAYGDARVYKELHLMMTGAELHPTQSPEWTAYKGGQALAFDSSSAQTIYFRAQFPPEWSQGTDITPRLHVVHQATETGTVIWDLTHSWANVGDAFPAETTIQKSFGSHAAVDIHSQGDIQDIPGVNKEIASVLIGSLTRRGDIDTSTTDALLLCMDFMILVDSIGSKTK